ncbi:unnamed protein product [Mytilus coruscus]|uniref:Uncharacterized protein n=1 Tax=Mytilus coruscus TaxID=42192 RepID=A0A6J8BFK4_MYTCO|nr:unnamed protein product [Mytilus coruscus]
MDKEFEAQLNSSEKEKTSAFKRLKEFKANLNSTEKKKISALKRVKEFEQKLKATESDKEDALKKIKEFEAKLNSIEKEKTSALKRVKDFEQKLKTTESDKEDALKKLTEYKSANAYLQKEQTNALETLILNIHMLMTYYDITQIIFDSVKIQYKTRITEAEKSVRLLTQEKSDALTRLSDIMGTKLRDNNPAITDLNDPNRPMKLGDQFSELYENEWTDAFSDIEIYDICLEDIEEQLSGHKKLVYGFSDDEIEPFLKTAKDSVKTNAANYIFLLYRVR